MKTTLLFALLSLSPFLTVQTCSASASAAGDLSGTITLSGAWALYPMVVRWAEEFQKEHPAVHVDIGAGGAGKGMADALTGAVDLGMVSRDIYDQEINQGAWWVSVARDAVVPVVSSSNPVLDSLRASGLAPDVLKRLWLEPGEVLLTPGDQQALLLGQGSGGGWYCIVAAAGLDPGYGAGSTFDAVGSIEACLTVSSTGGW